MMLKGTRMRPRIRRTEMAKALTAEQVCGTRSAALECSVPIAFYRFFRPHLQSSTDVGHELICLVIVSPLVQAPSG